MNTKPTRFQFLDTLRGFTIAGILLVNIRDITLFGHEASYAAIADSQPQQWLNLLVGGRFVPIFELLFGMSLAFVAASARSRGANPAATLLCRLGALLGIALLHTFVYPGEVLRAYALAGLLCLPLVVWAPRWALLGLGVVGTGVGFGMFGGGFAATPGLFLLGAAAVAYQIPMMLERAGWPVRIAAVVAAVATVPALFAQVSVGGDPRFSNEGGIAGGVMAALYIGLLALLFATRARRVLRAVFEPLGRMALTNYTTASLIVFPIGLALDWQHQSDLTPALLVAAAVLIAQLLASRAWLSYFSYGPLEWAWRCVTWRRMVPLRRGVTRREAAPRRAQVLAA